MFSLNLNVYTYKMGDDITLAAERGEGSQGGPATPKFTKIDKKVDSSKENIEV